MSGKQVTSVILAAIGMIGAVASVWLNPLTKSDAELPPRDVGNQHLP